MKPVKLLILIGFIVILLTFLHSCNKNKEEDNKPKGPVTDIDGNDYDTIAIDTMVWLVQNLKVTKFNDGAPIPQSPAWMTLTTPAYTWYDNDPATYKEPYGALYNWYAVNTEKLCPAGWHVPTNAEWTAMASYLGGISEAGGKLKEEGSLHWLDPNDATNETGFTALPGGNCNSFGLYNDIGITGYWWSATENDSIRAFNRDISYQNSVLYSNINKKVHGFSVRCVKD